MKHGFSKSRTYTSWRCMIQRCTNPNHPYYHCYGGRGIYVCERWLKFENFLADMGERPPGSTLNRKDPDDPYDPFGCDWLDAGQQARNRRSNTVLEYNGLKLTLVEWAEKLTKESGTLITRHRIMGRLKRTGDIAYALEPGKNTKKTRS